MVLIGVLRRIVSAGDHNCDGVKMSQPKEGRRTGNLGTAFGLRRIKRPIHQSDREPIVRKPSAGAIVA